MKRLFDFVAATVLLIVFAIPLIAIVFLVWATSRGPAIYWSDRVAKNNGIFRMPKFRTMKTDAPDVATDMIKDPRSHFTKIGGILRATSIDELPQIYSILKGDMSFVGPRPALSSQYDLLKLRSENEIDQLVPGLTGWAQVNGRDELTTQEKVEFEVEYLSKNSIWFDLKIICMTFSKVFRRSEISH